MCKKGKDVDMQEKNMVPRKKGIIINAFIARWKTISCIIPIEEDFREYGTSTTTVSRNRKLYTTSAIDCANSNCSSRISSSNASCSNNSDSTAISNTFNTGFLMYLVLLLYLKINISIFLFNETISFKLHKLSII